MRQAKLALASSCPGVCSRRNKSPDRILHRCGACSAPSSSKMPACLLFLLAGWKLESRVRLPSSQLVPPCSPCFQCLLRLEFRGGERGRPPVLTDYSHAYTRDPPTKSQKNPGGSVSAFLPQRKLAFQRATVLQVALHRASRSPLRSQPSD